MTKPSQVIFSHVRFMNSTLIQWDSTNNLFQKRRIRCFADLMSVIEKLPSSNIVSGADAASMQTLGSSEPITLTQSVNLYAKVY
uniref:Putative ovule protein n=1 Tax=Solanum chacoense TaxID=4108 RepID=A0A0V0GVP4_SOLCH